MLQWIEQNSSKKTYNIRLLCLALLILAGVCVVGNMTRISQDVNYHLFADTQKWIGIENASNVISNIGFMLAGIAGLRRMRKWTHCSISFMWRFFFWVIVFVGVGSAYYHWQPSNETLFWDRLPMTMGFASLTACVCAERFGLVVGRFLFAPLVTSGAFSVIYWLVTEQAGRGDLRPYILIQYFPMLLIPLIISFFPKENQSNQPYWILLAAYTIAKFFELQDTVVFQWTNGLVSGHALKHIVAAAGILLFRPNLERIVVQNEENIG